MFVHFVEITVTSPCQSPLIPDFTMQAGDAFLVKDL